MFPSRDSSSLERFSKLIRNIGSAAKRLPFIAAAAPCLLFVFSSATAQVTLTGTSYAEDFNTLDSLPTGWSVSTNATLNSLGTGVGFTSTTTAWNATTAGTDFRNISNFELNEGSQSANMDRALGWRPLSAASREGAVTLSLTDTMGYEDFALSFTLFTANDIGSSNQVYAFEYRIGDSGDFIQLGASYTTGAAFNLSNYTFNTADLVVLNDQDSTIYLRFRGTSTSGSGNLDTFGIDNFQLSYASAVPEPSTYAVLGGLAALSATIMIRFNRRRQPVNVRR